jgi:mono/diheme cytochrome c family protein
LRTQARSTFNCAGILVVVAIFSFIGFAASQTFRNAPASTTQIKNPYSENTQAAATGKKLYAQNCAQCHGNNLRGMGPAPALDSAKVRTAKPGELFWFITTGNLSSGMPSWAKLPKQQRWQIVTFLQKADEQKTAAE